jgi:hypothetical protein
VRAVIALVLLLGVVPASADTSEAEWDKIMNTLLGARPRLVRCYKGGQKPVVRIGYKFELAIRKDGIVTRTTVNSGDAARDACVAKVLGALRFPTLRADTVVSIPM